MPKIAWKTAWSAGSPPRFAMRHVRSPKWARGGIARRALEPSKTRLRHEADSAAWMRSEVSASNPACVRAIHRNNQATNGSRLGLTGSGTERIKRSSTNESQRVEEKHRHDRQVRALLRSSRKRPRSERSCRHAQEIPPSHSITSSARARSVGGIVRLRAFAVCRLISSSNLVGCCTGRSAAEAPPKILWTYRRPCSRIDLSLPRTKSSRPLSQTHAVQTLSVGAQAQQRVPTPRGDQLKGGSR